jgi:hypothetical protein
MNEFTAKKLGEVLAFANVGVETFEKGRNSFVSVLGEETVKKYFSLCEKHEEKILKIAAANNVEEIVTRKVEGTGAKLRSMRDLYVANEWDNPTELLEWSGFFEGAAVVHWSLVKGIGEATKHPEIIKLAEEGYALHQEILSLAVEHLNDLGKKKST